MSDILDSIKSVLEGPIDYESQKFTEDLTFKLLIACAAISSIAGFIAQDLKVLLLFFGLSVLVTLALVVPPYPGYNKKREVGWVAPKITGFS
jgi:signal peptidase complex subunit 1